MSSPVALPVVGPTILGVAEPAAPAAWLPITQGWSVDPVALVLCGAALVAYAAAVRSLGARGHRWPVARSVAFGTGVTAIAIATMSGIARVEDTVFSAHATQHVLLGIVASFAIALGAPVTLAIRATPRRVQTRIVRAVRSRPLALLSHPIVAWLLFATTLFALYLTPLYELSLRNGAVHALVHAQVLLAGTVFFWVALGVDPAARRLPGGARLVMVALTVPFHSFLALTLLNTATPIADRWYRAVTGSTTGALLADQHAGASIMWVAGDAIGLVTSLVVLAAWVRAEERRAIRVDRRLDDADATSARVALRTRSSA